MVDGSTMGDALCGHCRIVWDSDGGSEYLAESLAMSRPLFEYLIWLTSAVCHPLLDLVPDASRRKSLYL